MAENEMVVDSVAQVQDQAPETAPVVESTSSEAPTESKPSAPVEKMIPQSQVNRIAAREAREAAEKVRAEYEAKYGQSQQSQSQQPNQPANIGGMIQISPEQLRQEIHRAARDMSVESQAQEIERNWKSTMNAEMDRDPEFAQAYQDLDIESNPGLLLEIYGMDNKVAVMKDLANNPSKYANILYLAGQNKGALAKKELDRLSASIKANEQAQKQPKVDAPLGHLKPSNIGTDNGEMGVSDFMSQPWLRG